MLIQKLMVVGAGQMGSGIAQVAAQAGLTVYLQDVEQRFVDRGIGLIEKNLSRDVEKQRRTAEEKALILGRIVGTTSLEPAADCDLVIEAIVENLEIKQELFRTLDGICPARTILASNTSSLPITQLASVTGRPDRFVGMHYMNPVPIMKLVEIIRGIATSDDTYLQIRTLAELMGKTTAVANDFPGFISNRILLPMLNEAMFCYYEGVASVQEIDTVMRLGMNHPMGPLTLADFIGLETCLSILNVLYEGYKDPKFRPCPLLVQMVQAGYLGKKSGRGFYIYGADGSVAPMTRTPI